MYAGAILFMILSILASIVLPIVLVVWLIKYFLHRKDPEHKTKSLGLRELMLVSIMISAGVAGISGIILIPMVFFGVEDIDGSNTALFIYLAASMLLLMLGIFLKDLTGKFLMILGIILLVVSVVPFVGNFGSTAAFIVLLLVFVALVSLIVRVSRKEKNG